jgi:hypothetical protein
MCTMPCSAVCIRVRTRPNRKRWRWPAGLSGLEALAGLAEPLTRAGYRVQLRSPGPVLSLIPPQMA